MIDLVSKSWLVTQGENAKDEPNVYELVKEQKLLNLS